MLSITFEFTGGPYDGEQLHGVLGDGSDAERYFLASNRGRIGQRFKIASQYAIETLFKEQLKAERRHFFQQHFYVITDRVEHEEEILVRARYLPDAIDSNRLLM